MFNWLKRLFRTKPITRYSALVAMAGHLRWDTDVSRLTRGGELLSAGAGLWSWALGRVGRLPAYVGSFFGKAFPNDTSFKLLEIEVFGPEVSK